MSSSALHARAGAESPCRIVQPKVVRCAGQAGGQCGHVECEEEEPGPQYSCAGHVRVGLAGRANTPPAQSTLRSVCQSPARGAQPHSGCYYTGVTRGDARCCALDCDTVRCPLGVDIGVNHCLLAGGPPAIRKQPRCDS